MSNLIDDKTLSSSLDCPVVAGKRQIQHIAPRTADVGGIPVNRVLPSRQRRLVGAWCFLDHAGPSVFKSDSSCLRVGPHPRTSNMPCCHWRANFRSTASPSPPMSRPIWGVVVTVSK